MTQSLSHYTNSILLITLHDYNSFSDQAEPYIKANQVLSFFVKTNKKMEDQTEIGSSDRK